MKILIIIIMLIIMPVCYAQGYQNYDLLDLESVYFNQTFQNEPEEHRIARLEQFLFNRTFPNSDPSFRIERMVTHTQNMYQQAESQVRQEMYQQPQVYTPYSPHLQQPYANTYNSQQIYANPYNNNMQKYDNYQQQSGFIQQVLPIIQMFMNRR